MWIYESFDFNDDGDIVFTQVFSDLASAYRILREPTTTGDEWAADPNLELQPGNKVVSLCIT